MAGPDQVRQAAIRSLGQIRKGLDPLTYILLRDPNPDFRLGALQSLGQLGDPASRLSFDEFQSHHLARLYRGKKERKHALRLLAAARFQLSERR